MNTKTRLAVAVAATMGLMSTAGHATIGYFAHGYGAVQGAMGGAGVALPQDAMIGAINPAGMAALDTHGVAGAAVFSPLRKYNIVGTPGVFPPFPTGGSIDSDNTVFLIPNFAYNWKLDDKSAVGVTVFGNGGMNTEWLDSDTPFGAGVFGGAFAGDPNAGADYKQLFINATYARKVSDGVSVGVTGIINNSRLQIDGLGAFAGFSTSPAAVSNVGKDSTWGFGGKFGILANVSDKVSIGASYQTKISSKMDKYAGLFANGGELDIPATATVGLAIKPDSKSAIAFDVQKIWYGDVETIGNSQSLLLSCMGGVVANCLGGSDGAGFGWKNMTVWKIGYQREVANGWTWRAGFATGSQPIPSSETTLNILFPAIMEEHITFGFGKKMNSGKELNVAFLYAPTHKVSGPSLLNPAETITLEMKQYQVQAELRF